MAWEVDPDRCAGHGACVATCPEVFAFTADGFAQVIVHEVPGHLSGAVDQALSQCPEQAIRPRTSITAADERHPD